MKLCHAISAFPFPKNLEGIRLRIRGKEESLRAKATELQRRASWPTIKKHFRWKLADLSVALCALVLTPRRRGRLCAVELFAGENEEHFERNFLRRGMV